MKPLCAGKDPDWWTPGSESARLAMAICRRCPGCPNVDPEPRDVIRDGVPYAVRGNVLPVCPDCGFPVADYAGGGIRCHRCNPAVLLPDVRKAHRRWIFHLLDRGFTPTEAAAEAGEPPSVVFNLTYRYRHTTQPERSAA